MNVLTELARRVVYVNAVTYWAVQGGSGWLNILRNQVEQGIRLDAQALADLRVLQAVLDNVIRRSEGQPLVPVPGGASGSIAAHFPHSEPKVPTMT